MRQLNGNGVTLREIPAPLTADQLRRKALTDEARRVQAIEQRQRDDRDRALLIAYTSVSDLEAARRRQIADIRDEIGVSRRRMIATHVDLEAAVATMKTQTAPAAKEAARRNVRVIAQSILADDAAVSRLEQDIVEINQRFDADRQRLAQLLRDPDPSVQMQASTRPANGVR